MERLKIKKPTLIDPRVLVLYSSQKTGKTEATLQLPNAITLDFDDSAGYFTGRYHSFPGTTKVEKYKSYVKYMTQLKEDVKENGKYDFLTIDTVTEFYSEFANTIAILEYNKNENKQLPITFNATLLPFGAGYALKRAAVLNLIDNCKNYAEHIIVLGHIGDKSVNKDTDSYEVADIDLEGKLKNILALKTDAIGFIYRDKNNENYINFKHSNSIAVGNRSVHLREKVILISKMVNGKLETYWENIYKNLKK